MPLLSTKLFQSSSYRVSAHLTLLLPVTLAAGCAGVLTKKEIIDYTVTEEEYHAAIKARQPATTTEPTLAAATPAPATPAAPAKATIAKVIPAVTPSVPKKPTIQKPVKAKVPATNKITHSKSIAESKTGISTNPQISTSNTKQIKVKEPKIARALDKSDYIKTSDFTRTIYATAGLGVTRINPDTSASPTFTPDEVIDGGGQVSLGVDLHRHLSLELHSADLGSAGLAPSGRVNFHLNGISALVYAGKNLNQFRRRGWNGYARLGFNQLENTPVGNVPFPRQTTNLASFGVGAEYNTPWGLGFRADLIAADGDVQYGQLGVLYRAGQRSRKPRLARALPKPVDNAPAINTDNVVVQPAIIKDQVAGPTIARAHAQSTPAQSAQVHPAILAATSVPTDPLESDLRLPKVDLNAQQATSHNTSHNSSKASNDSCSVLNGVLNDVNFYTSSADLTRAAVASLNKIANTLNTCTSRNVVISAHTDSEGSAATNNSLSKNRARNVAFHLARQGVSMQRIRAVAYGESQPIASNSTAEGRLRNRRVELLVQ